MKKLVTFFAILLLTLAVAPTFALATTTEQEICDFALQNDKIKKAKCVVYERSCIVAIQTEKFANKTEYCNFVTDFENQVREKYQIDNVFVTRNPKVMNRLDKLDTLDDTQKQEEIQKLIGNFLNKPMPLPIRPPKPIFEE